MADYEAFAGDTDVARSGRIWYRQEGEKVFVDLSATTIEGHILMPEGITDIQIVGFPDPDQVVNLGLFAFVLNLDADLTPGLYNIEWQLTTGSTEETWSGDSLNVVTRQVP